MAGPKRRMTGLCVALMALVIPASGEEITVQNDSLVGGDTGGMLGDFVAGEHGGVRLIAPCDGSIVAVQILWWSAPGQDASIERAIHIYDGSTFPTPGVEWERLDSPLLTPRFLNEFRHVDQAQTIPLDVPVKAGQAFYVTLEFENPTDIASGGPSLVYDLDGCHPAGNVLFAIPGGWMDFCDFPIGDVAIRAVIDCNELSGACCLPDGSCEALTASDCAAEGGTYQGDLTDCASVECPQPLQACCFEATGGCLDLTEEDCLLAGGIPGGLGTECATYACFPIGACCLPDGSCQEDLSPEECDVLGGVFQGDGTTCDDVDCPEPTGACCFETGGCLVLTEANCAITGGAWAGAGTDCSDGDGSGTADACEQTCPGDTDLDGDVDLSDLSQLLSHYRETGDVSWGDGDFDGDGDVDLSDLSALLANYGEECP